MITKISKLYMDKIEELAKEFAHNHAKQYRDFSYTRTYNATVKAYRNFGIFFYIATNKLSFSNRDFRFNHIFVKAFTILSNRLYKKILTHLEKNKIIRINNHYMIGKTSPDNIGGVVSSDGIGYTIDWHPSGRYIALGTTYTVPNPDDGYIYIISFLALSAISTSISTLLLSIRAL